MDAEIWSILNAMFKGILINEDTLALDTIKRVGPGGNYLGQPHTRDHMRKRWLPKLMDRRPYNAWEANQNGAREWAGEEARAILHDHKPEPLDPKLEAELNAIIAVLENSR